VLERIVTGRRSSVMSRGGLGSGSPSRAPHILVSEVSMNSFAEGASRRPGYPGSTSNEDSRRASTHSVGPVFMHVSTHSVEPVFMHVSTHSVGPVFMHVSTHSVGPVFMHVSTHSVEPVFMHVSKHSVGPVFMHVRLSYVAHVTHYHTFN
jgi:hypothetical protein